MITGFAAACERTLHSQYCMVLQQCKVLIYQVQLHNFRSPVWAPQFDGNYIRLGCPLAHTSQTGIPFTYSWVQERLHVGEGHVQLPYAPVLTQDQTESSRPCPGLSHLRRAREVCERLL